MKAATALLFAVAVLITRAAAHPSSADQVELFDRSILNGARALLPPSVPLGANIAKRDEQITANTSRMLKRRGAGLIEARDVDGDVSALVERGSTAKKDNEDDCDDEDDADDDEQCDSGNDDDEDCEDEDDKPASKPASKPADKPVTSPKSNGVGSKVVGVNAQPAVAQAAVAASSSLLKTPSNLSKGSFTVEDGCTSYYVPVSGDYCYKVIQGTKLSLEQFYCLNPDLTSDCQNLNIGVSYCTGFSGVWP